MTKDFTPVSALSVMLDFGNAPVPVGRLARRDGKIFFEYDADFIAGKLELSPFKLPLMPGLQVFEPGLFEGCRACSMTAFPMVGGGFCWIVHCAAKALRRIVFHRWTGWRMWAHRAWARLYNMGIYALSFCVFWAIQPSISARRKRQLPPTLKPGIWPSAA